MTHVTVSNTMLDENERIAMSLPDQRKSRIPVEELRRRLREEPLVPHEEVLEKAKKYL